jgi:uncharacterized membrane protein
VWFTVGLGYLLLLPPFQNPDEPAHFFRAYQLSLGHWEANRHENMLGDWVACTVHGDVHRLMDLCIKQDQRISPTSWWREARQSVALRRTGSDPLVWANFPNTALYAPIPYIPQIVGILVSYWTGGGVFLSLYLGRFFALLIGVVAIAYALRNLALAGESRLAFGIVACLPMTFHQVASLSADSVLFSASFALFATFVRLRKSCSSAPFAGYLVLAFLLSSIKFFYGLIGLMILPSLWLKEDSWWRKWMHSGAVLAASLVPAVLWSLLVKDSFVVMRSDVFVEPWLQLQSLMEHPLLFLSAVVHTDFFCMWISAVAVFGWLSVIAPMAYIKVYSWIGLLFMILPMDTWTGASAQKRKSAHPKMLWIFLMERLWVAALALGVMMCVHMVMYLIHTEVGANKVDGLQGRYFIPLLPLLAFAVGIRPSRLTLSAKVRSGLMYAAVGLWLATLYVPLQTLINRYWQW